jgi:hypothetical protein
MVLSFKLPTLLKKCQWFYCVVAGETICCRYFPQLLEHSQQHHLHFPRGSNHASPQPQTGSFGGSSEIINIASRSRASPLNLIFSDLTHVARLCITDSPSLSSAYNLSLGTRLHHEKHISLIGVPP